MKRITKNSTNILCYLEYASTSAGTKYSANFLNVNCKKITFFRLYKWDISEGALARAFIEIAEPYTGTPSHRIYEFDSRVHGVDQDEISEVITIDCPIGIFRIACIEQNHSWNGYQHSILILGTE